MTLGIIRVLTTDDPDILLEHGRLLEKEYGLRSSHLQNSPTFLLL